MQPDDAIWWRFRYRWAGRERLLSTGPYPDTSLKLARDDRDAARQQLAAGVDPSAVRKAEKGERSNTFEAIARQWLKLEKKMQAGTIEQLRKRLESYAFRPLGNKPIKTISAQDVLEVLRSIEAKGTVD